MLNKYCVLGLLTASFASAIVDDTLIHQLGLSHDASLHNQAVLHSANRPPIPANHTMMMGDTLRAYLLAIPSDYDPAKKWPLIVDFHGRNGQAEGQWDNSQYYLRAAGREYFVAYPYGCYGAGNTKDDGTIGPPERAWEGAPYADESCDDLAFVDKLVKDLQAEYSIDSTRTFASGKSNGGGFADTLACSDTGNLFAAFAMASAALYTDTFIGPDACVGYPKRMILESHGVDDHTIPIRGRKDGTTPDIAQWAKRWALRNGCDPDYDPVPRDESWGKSTRYSCLGLTNMVEQFRVDHLGHCWPSLTDNTDSREHGTAEGECVQTLDYTLAVLGFFARW